MAPNTHAAIVRPVAADDAAAICAVYNPFVTGTAVTFEEEEVAPATMRRRIAERTATLPWLVYEENGAVGGYVYATRWRAHSAYRYSVETSIYLAPGYQGRGLGRLLYRYLIGQLRELRIHRAMAGIALPNPASVALHEATGFEKVAVFDEAGYKFGRWIDVGYWQLRL